MKIIDVEQGSPEWLKARLGIPTSSNFDKIITPAKGELSASRFAYMHQLAAEALTGEPTDSFVETEWMARGKAMEPDAAADYEFQEDAITKVVGFVTTDDGLIGASPDRLVLDAAGNVIGGLEIKCPAPQTLIGYWANGFGDKYKVQVQGGIYVAELEWVDRWAYHPRFPRVRDRTYRDSAFIQKLGDALAQFTDELQDLIRRLRATGMFDAPLESKTPVDVAYGPAADA
jgi:hypothetical protein